MARIILNTNGRRSGKSLFCLLLTAMFFASSCVSQHAGWKLVWQEDFKGKTIDESVWSRIHRGPSDWNDMMSLRSDLAYVENGELVLLGKVNNGTSNDTTRFVTGGVSSRGKKSFQMARFEIKAKFNHAQGFWPALWLMPDKGLPHPNYAEIDIMDHLNADTMAYQTVHSHYSLHIADQNKPAHSATGSIKVGDWNTYATEVWPDSICMFINGRKTLTYPRLEGKEYQFPWAGLPFYIILSNQLGGQWVGPVSPDQLPSELRVDWIKVFQRKK